ncbi:MAG: molybdopterin dinucleotide binding domain-containing protein, partial [Caldilineaceae bacterium]
DTGDALVVISPPAHSFLNSTFVNIERFRAREGAPLLQMHPLDAAARRLATGDLARVSNACGEVLLPVVITNGLTPGTVLAPGVWWARFATDGRTINQVVPQDEADMGAGAIFYDTVVHVERAEPAALSGRPPTAAAVVMA